MLRSLPVRDPGAPGAVFSWLYPRDPPQNFFSLANYQLYRDHSTVFADVFGLARLVTEARSGSEPVVGEVVTGNFFQALGVRAAIGRVLEPSDDVPGAAPVAIVSAGYWKRRFNGEPAGPWDAHRE